MLIPPGYSLATSFTIALIWLPAFEQCSTARGSLLRLIILHDVNPAVGQQVVFASVEHRQVYGATQARMCQGMILVSVLAAFRMNLAADKSFVAPVVTVARKYNPMRS